MRLPFSQPPPPSSRPPVTGYRISHNITGGVTVNQTTHTEFFYNNIYTGIYEFAVLAVNSLGDGKEESTIISG